MLYNICYHIKPRLIIWKILLCYNIYVIKQKNARYFPIFQMLSCWAWAWEACEWTWNACISACTLVTTVLAIQQNRLSRQLVFDLSSGTWWSITTDMSCSSSLLTVWYCSWSCFWPGPDDAVHFDMMIFSLIQKIPDCL